MLRTPALIGVSASVLHRDPERRLYNGRPLLYLEQSMSTWMMQAGARPYVIPFAPGHVSTAVSLEEMVDGLDGLVLQGGVDVAPESYGEAEMAEKWPGDPVRDAYEIELVQACLRLGKPVLGICRGLQILNVALGGTLYQDIPTQVDDALTHLDRPRYADNAHPIEMVEGGWLSGLYGGETRAMVNSVHHQAVKDLGEGLIVDARAPDGVVEAARLDDPEHWAAGVQWHPEFQTGDDDGLLDRFAVFDDFLSAVA